MDFKHVPVLYEECLEGLAIKPDGIYVDGTLGGAGHAFGIGSRLSEKGILIGIDRDKEAIKAAEKRLESLSCTKFLVQSTYDQIEDVLTQLQIDGIDGALLDIGVSSYQLDNGERGFSYMHDAPLDMRMNQDDSFSAYDVVNGYDKKKLTEIIRKYGEERWASRISDFIVKHRREEGDIKTTGELVDIIKAAIPASARREGPHPAKRTFQAIRIELNRELQVLENSIDTMIELLNPGGRLSVITFHSLEDRIVKNRFRINENPCTCPPEFPVCMCGKKSRGRVVTRKPILPSDEELSANKRSKSAKLRVFEKAGDQKQ